MNVLVPAGVTPARVSKLQLTEAVVETVKAGLGVSVMARWAVTPHLREGTLRAIPMTEAGLVRRWWAAVPRRRRQTSRRLGVDRADSRTRLGLASGHDRGHRNDGVEEVAEPQILVRAVLVVVEVDRWYNESRKSQSADER